MTRLNTHTITYFHYNTDILCTTKMISILFARLFANSNLEIALRALKSVTAFLSVVAAS